MFCAGGCKVYDDGDETRYKYKVALPEAIEGTYIKSLHLRQGWRVRKICQSLGIQEPSDIYSDRLCARV